MADSEAGLIVVRVVGGLGNQMFQYACGRAAALRSGSELMLDLSAFERYKIHRFGLDAFCINASLAPRRLQTGSALRAALRRLGVSERLQMGLQGLTYIEENEGLGFQPSVMDRRANNYLNGYWQDERYFSDAADVVRSEFQLRGRASLQDADAINDSDSPRVSLHIRRGDYVNNPKANLVHGVLDLDYYRRAVQALSDRIGERFRIIVFSDDIPWARQNLIFPQPMTFVCGSTTTPHEDLLKMASCDHHIIANSSFSWWGAWLNSSRNKIVISPKRWFVSAELAHQHTCPDVWVRV